MLVIKSVASRGQSRERYYPAGPAAVLLCLSFFLFFLGGLRDRDGRGLFHLNQQLGVLFAQVVFLPSVMAFPADKSVSQHHDFHRIPLKVIGFIKSLVASAAARGLFPAGGATVK